MAVERQQSADAAPAREPELVDRLFAASYAELRRLAGSKLRNGPGAAVSPTSPTSLVHETYINMARRNGSRFADRGRFLSYAARAMCGLLVDFARRRPALKRSAGLHVTHLDEVADVQSVNGVQLQRLMAALDALAALDPRLAEVVDLRYFCGLSFAEIAAARGASARTVQRDWDKARLLLYGQLGEE